MLAHASVLDGQGYARRVVDSALALRRALGGLAVTLASIESPRALRRREPREEVARLLAPAGIDLEILHAWPRRLGLARWSDRAAVIAVRRLVARRGIDAIHAHGPRAARTALRAAGNAYPVVADVHGDRAAEARLERGVADGPETPPDPEEAAVAREASGVVHASERLAERFPASAGRPTALVPCLVADDRIPSDERAEVERAERRRTLGCSEDVRVIAYAGSLAAWQEVPRLARVVRHALDRVPQARVLVLTTERAEAERILLAAGIAKGLFAVLSPKPESVVDALLAADAGVVLRRPALANALAFPTKFAEYLAAGLEVVVADAVPALASRVASHPALGHVLPFSDDDATWAARVVGAAKPAGRDERAVRRAYARTHLAWSSAEPTFRSLYAAL